MFNHSTCRKYSQDAAKKDEERKQREKSRFLPTRYLFLLFTYALLFILKRKTKEERKSVSATRKEYPTRNENSRGERVQRRKNHAVQLLVGIRRDIDIFASDAKLKNIRASGFSTDVQNFREFDGFARLFFPFFFLHRRKETPPVGEGLIIRTDLISKERKRRSQTLACENVNPLIVASFQKPSKG